MTQSISAFDLSGPLPTGVTVLEASAGTGKTFAIAALAARYVAAGTPLEQLLLVTFTRMATGELRERVRDRLVSAEEGLRRALAGVDPGDDEVLRLLTCGPRHELEVRQRLLAQALTDFDAATISTTHGFCQEILSGLGVAGDVERDVTFVEDLHDLVEEVVDDLYVTRFHGSDPPFDLAMALEISQVAIKNPFVALEPAAVGDETQPGMRRRFAEAVRAEVELRKRRGGILTFDDYLARLRDTLADERGGEAACQRLRDRYHVALVDEFQDTDPVQWEIMRRAFAEGDATLVLIGDPKQAIYAFRGADVYAYLEAGRHATTKATLDTNWRSDKGLIDAYDALFGGARLGHEDIPYRRVQAAASHHDGRLDGAPITAPLRLRIVERASGLVPVNPRDGFIPVEDGRVHVAEDLAADVVRLLSSGAEILSRQPNGSATARQRVGPGHIAVLVRANREAGMIRSALDAAGIPAVINGAGSVFATTAADEWLRLLQGLEHPASSTHAASVALTSFLGWNAEQLACAEEPELVSILTRLQRWADLLRRRGAASLLEAMTRGEGLPGRMLARERGERELTDLRHIGQLLHAVATSEQLGVTALTTWLRHRIAEPADDAFYEERTRRLESDAEAVQVRTIHGSKGLEFPIVYCPYLWIPGPLDIGEPLPIYHDPDAGDERTIDVGGAKGPDFFQHREQFVAEQRGEELRLAYVALTRAQHQAVVWWAGSMGSRDSALSRLLFSRDDDGNIAPEGERVPPDEEVTARFHALAAEAPGCVSVESSAGATGATWSNGPGEPVDLEAGTFDRRLDFAWRRTSYSSITSAAHEAWVASEPEQHVVSDEAPAGARQASATGDAADPDEALLRSVPASFAEMPGGLDVGTFVHSIMETTDFAVDDLDAELAGRVDAELARNRLDIGDRTAVVAGLRAAIETPLGPMLGERRLRDIGRPDRLEEMAFELPLVGGDATRSPKPLLDVLSIASLLAEHLPVGDALAGYAARLAEPALQGDLRGYLAGSLDLVVRTREPDGTQRFAVIDYKTNWLGPDGEPLSAWHYRPAALVREMEGAHYPLQALLYITALHRYLRWRLRGYDPERNLAGAFYLFVRGMTGAATPRVGTQPCGVFAWNPPVALVDALSDLLDRGTARR